MAPDLIYLDNNATTPLAPEVFDAMVPFLREQFGNASSPHPAGRAAAQAVARARAQTARLFGATAPEEVVFTSGGTEALNAAIFAAARRARAEPSRTKLITTATEHPAVLAPLERLAADSGFRLEVLAVGADGQLDTEVALAAIDAETALVSLLWGNNESGVLLTDESIERLGQRAREAGAWLHLDAVQAAGKQPLELARRPVDLASISAHKLHGPKGAGALYVRAGLELPPLLCGGSQEEGRRAGTLNVPGLVGLGAAAELAHDFVNDASALAALAARRDGFERALLGCHPEAVIHGREAPRAPNTINVALPGVSADSLMMLLGEFGVCVSTGAACGTGKRKASHVLLAMGVDPDLARSSLRISLSRQTTEAELEAGLEALSAAVEQLQALAL